MSHINSFTAISFKLSECSYYSICQAGIIRIKDGKVIDKLELLIQPPKNFYLPDNINKNRIYPAMTISSPTFDKAWTKILPFIKEQHVVAHNMPFHLICLKHTLKYYDIPMPEFTNHCTYKIYEKKSLKELCNFYEIELFSNKATSEAMACAHLFYQHIEENKIK